MKNKYFILAVSGTLFFAACHTSNKMPASAGVKSESEAFKDFSKQKSDGKNFGATVTPSGAVSYDDLLPRFKTTDTFKNVKVTGVVDAVCKVRGCWMNIKSDAGASPMFVKFKNYAFFMPKDIAGKRVVMSGDAFKEIIPVEELRHYAEDDGKSKEEIAKITQPETKIRFVASGVTIF